MGGEGPAIVGHVSSNSQPIQWQSFSPSPEAGKALSLSIAASRALNLGVLHKQRRTRIARRSFGFRLVLLL